MKIIIPGIYPRSERLISATRDFDRKRISLDELETIRKEDIDSFIKLQANFKYISTGLFNWQDILRPFSEIIKSCRVSGLVRFYETNTFVKALEFENTPSIIDGKLDGWIKRYLLLDKNGEGSSNILLTLPFLYLFKTFSSGISTDRIASILIDIITNLGLDEDKAICFIEPTFGFRKIDDYERKEGAKFIYNLKSKINCPVFIQTFFFSIENDADFIFNLPVDGYGIDFYANSLSDVIEIFPSGKSLLTGIININSTIIEDVEEIINFIEKLKEYIPADMVYLTTNGPPELLPRQIIDEKIDSMKEITKWN